MSRDSNAPEEDGTVSIELGVSRRNLIKQLSAAGLVAGVGSLAGCSGLRTDASETQSATSVPGDQGESSGNSESLPSALRVPLIAPPTADQMNLANPTHEQRRMVFVTHVVNEFFTGALVGMNDGLHKNGWKGEFIGPSQHDTAQQIEMLNTTIDRLKGGRDVIATTVLDRTQYKRPIQKAFNKGIPVASYNTNVYAGDYNAMMDTFGHYIPYAGQKFVSAGVAVGLTGYERAREQLDDEELVMLPTIAVPGHPALSKRVEGFRQAFKAQENTVVLDTLNLSDDLSQGISRIQSKYRSNPEINVILGSGWWGPVAGGRLVESQGLKDQMVVGGFDLPKATLNGIQKGTIDFTGGQDPYSQGYMPTQLAWEYMERGIPMKDYNTGISIIDQSNIAFAERRSGAWGQLNEWQRTNYSV
jgi:ABC-type sugar transport system substrate-binding protein